MDTNIIKQLDILDYYGQVVSTLDFSPTIDLNPRNIVVRDFVISNVEEEDNELIVSLQFDNGKETVYDNYDVESRTSELLECLRMAVEDLDSSVELDESYLNTTVTEAFQRILNPQESFEEFDY